MYAIVVSRFNQEVTECLLRSTMAGFKACGVGPGQVDVYWVPGALEISATIKLLSQNKPYRAFVALGAVVQGQTHHFRVIADQAASSIAGLGVHLNIPVIFGVLTTFTLEQAMERVEQGYDYARYAVEMADLFERVKKGTSQSTDHDKT